MQKYYPDSGTYMTATPCRTRPVERGPRPQPFSTAEAFVIPLAVTRNRLGLEHASAAAAAGHHSNACRRHDRILAARAPAPALPRDALLRCGSARRRGPAGGHREAVRPGHSGRVDGGDSLPHE